VSWKVACGQTTGAGSLTYSSEAFYGEQHMTIFDGTVMKESYRGNYLGACGK